MRTCGEIIKIRQSQIGNKEFEWRSGEGALFMFRITSSIARNVFMIIARTRKIQTQGNNDVHHFVCTCTFFVLLCCLVFLYIGDISMNIMFFIKINMFYQVLTNYLVVVYLSFSNLTYSKNIKYSTFYITVWLSSWSSILHTVFHDVYISEALGSIPGRVSVENLTFYNNI